MDDYGEYHERRLSFREGNMPMQDATITVTYWRKALWKLLRALPHAMIKHWRWMRSQGCERWVSLVGAWMLSGIVVKVGR